MCLIFIFTMSSLQITLQSTEVWLLPHHWDCLLLSRFSVPPLLLNRWTHLISSTLKLSASLEFFGHSRLLQTRPFKSNPLISMVFHFPDVSSECLAFLEGFSSSTYFINCDVLLGLIYLSFLTVYFFFLWLILSPCMSSTSTIWYWSPRMYVFSPYFFSEL